MHDNQMCLVAEIIQGWCIMNDTWLLHGRQESKAGGVLPFTTDSTNGICCLLKGGWLGLSAQQSVFHCGSEHCTGRYFRNCFAWQVFPVDSRDPQPTCFRACWEPVQLYRFSNLYQITSTILGWGILQLPVNATQYSCCGRPYCTGTAQVYLQKLLAQETQQ